jgi:hypothetical protein
MPKEVLVQIEHHKLDAGHDLEVTTCQRKDGANKCVQLCLYEHSQRFEPEEDRFPEAFITINDVRVIDELILALNQARDFLEERQETQPKQRKCLKLVEVPMGTLKKGDRFVLDKAEDDDDTTCPDNELCLARSDAYVAVNGVAAVQCDVLARPVSQHTDAETRECLQCGKRHVKDNCPRCRSHQYHLSRAPQEALCEVRSETSDCSED